MYLQLTLILQLNMNGRKHNNFACNNLGKIPMHLKLMYKFLAHRATFIYKKIVKGIVSH